MLPWRRYAAMMCLAAACCVALPAPGEEEKTAEDDSVSPLNVKTPTLGGKQFWADELVFRDWRIQRHVLSGHYRLLDGSETRHAWGTWDECRTKLDEIKRDRKLPPIEGKCIIVLHGLFRSRGAMTHLCKYLGEQQEFTVLSVGYPSTREPIATHAKHLARVIDGLEGATEINFVAHSLGNLVIRHYLADHTDAEKGVRPDSRIHRIVMLGPPNLGAELAIKLTPLDFSGQVAGKAGQQLADGWKELEPHLATPACEFAILAGGRANPQGLNPLLPGDDDLVVTVASTRLPGARDFRVLPVIHTTMMNDATVQQFTLHFIRHGCFVTDASREPIELKSEE